MTIVAMKRVLSKPRRVWCAELKLSFPPNAPPIAAPVCCSKTAAISAMDRTTCIYGRIEEIAFIGESIAGFCGYASFVQIT